MSQEVNSYINTKTQPLTTVTYKTISTMSTEVSTLVENKTNISQRLKYLLILDFEATCDDKKQPKPQEIIEFPTLLYSIENRRVEQIFHHYIKPDVNDQLTEFCTDLTGITQEQIDEHGISLMDALQKHKIWLLENNLLYDSSDDSSDHDASPSVRLTPDSFVYLTCGDWDLGTCLPRQLKHLNQKNVPPHFKKWINVKKEFSKLYNKKAYGMTGMLNILDLELEGRHHSGIDDCKNIARICTQMLNDGWVPKF